MAEFLSKEAGYVLEEDVERALEEDECEGVGYASMGWVVDGSAVLSGHWCCILLGFPVEMEDEVIHDRLAAIEHEVGMECQSYSLSPGTDGAGFVRMASDELVKRLGFAREKEGRMRAGRVVSVMDSVGGDVREWKRLLDLWEENATGKEVVDDVREYLETLEVEG